MIQLDGRTLTITQVVSVARDFEEVKLAKTTKEAVKRSADYVQELASSGRIVYGVTTGFGPLSEVVIPDQKAQELQRNLLISHAAGVGNNFPTEVVRAAILLRANTLAKGYSGIRLATLETLIAFLNKRVHPVVPIKGSVGASGDLAPLSHMALVLIGKGQAEYHGEILPGDEALRRAGIAPIILDRKEGVALINGTQFMTALASLVVADAHDLIATAEIAAALSIEALEGVIDAFDHRIHDLRPHPGQQKTAQNLYALLQESNLVLTSFERGELADQASQELQALLENVPQQERKAFEKLLHYMATGVLELDQQLAVESDMSAASLRQHRDTLLTLMDRLGLSNTIITAALDKARKPRRVQDAYSLRCTPQVYGAARDAINYVVAVVTTEINAATDNPLIFPHDKAFLSGGNFHGQPIALAMDLLTIAVTSIGTIAERRIARLIDCHLSGGLPLLLLQPTHEDHGVQYGLGLAQITAAALVAECQTLCSPASITTIPTSANQEDHVSMGTIAARQTREVVTNIEHIIAIEFLCATQGIDLRKLQKPVQLGLGTRIAYPVIRELIPRITTYNGEKRDRLTQDTLVHRDIEKLRELIYSKRLLKQISGQVSGFTA